jgi:5-methylcytosine-specific restriction endonuclease McrA
MTRHSQHRGAPPQLRQAILARDGLFCRRCGRPLQTTDRRRADYAEIGHVTAFARGGTLDPRNLQVECLLCNRSAGSTLRDELRLERAAAAIAPRPDELDRDGLLHHFNEHGQWETYRPAGGRWQRI